MTTVLALDPGRNHCGHALLVDSRLIQCGVSRLPREGSIWPLGKVCEFHFLRILVPKCLVDRVIVERMSLNRGRDSTLSKCIATGNDLLCLQAIGAFIAGRMGGTLEYVPHHPTPKEVTKNRVLWALSESELEIFNAAASKLGKKVDDLADSVKHGLNAVGR